jgi:Flp pilus assembly protein TadB
MSNQSKADRLRNRAARLHREALNCLSIAVNARDGGDAAQLIDEAQRLIRRSAELGEMPG